MSGLWGNLAGCPDHGLKPCPDITCSDSNRPRMWNWNGHLQSASVRDQKVRGRRRNVMGVSNVRKRSLSLRSRLCPTEARVTKRSGQNVQDVFPRRLTRVALTFSAPTLAPEALPAAAPAQLPPLHPR